MCLICLELKDLPGEDLDLEAEIKALEELYEIEVCTKRKGPTIETMTEEFPAEWFEDWDEWTDGIMQAPSMSGPEGWQILDQPATGTRGTRSDSVMHSCDHEIGQTPLGGFWICKHCGKDIEKVYG